MDRNLLFQIYTNNTTRTDKARTKFQLRFGTQILRTQKIHIELTFPEAVPTRQRSSLALPLKYQPIQNRSVVRQIQLECPDGTDLGPIPGALRRPLSLLSPNSQTESSSLGASGGTEVCRRWRVLSGNGVWGYGQSPLVHLLTL
ncbi:hypothetical protein U1Q18_013523, partial [Sarracenia purpurea var. burkii]